ncbi:MAG: insulinase family protein [Salinivirgaceae bacterium]|nr:insulinase family protein [Salinivirgaceae bacterium]
MNKIRKMLGAITALGVIGMVSATFTACNTQSVNVPGYKLIEKRFVKEVNADVYYFEHLKSGAHVLKFDTKDANKTFGVGFKTEPNSHSGTSHIIEHSVLNGSKNFPVKSPFEEMGKTSLKTFLNAFTASEWTFYPVASMNEKDYFNLMTVYLDAVFFPFIKDDPRIFMQEGWHYELTDKDSPIVYKGVVYNEMKGVFSSPQRELSFQISKNLFPDNGYGLSSGGYPLEIPNLTYEAFVEYYSEHYHPANSCIFVYGDADIHKELELIDKNYLSTFDKIEIDSKIKLQEPFAEFKKVTAPYASLEGAPTEDQTFLSLNWVYGLNTDNEISWALDILADVLVRQESGPIRLALQEAGIGHDVSAYANNSQQNVFSINVQNANAADADKFKEIVIAELKKASENGIDKNAIEAYVNRMEFNLREGNDSQKGLSSMLESFQHWIFTNDPFAGLQWENQLLEVKEAIKNNFLEKTIMDGLVNNNFGLLMVLEPKPGLEKEINKITEEKLAAYKASLSDEEIENLIKETQELIEHQKKENTAEELAVLPRLSREDLNPKADWFAVTEKEVNGIKVIHYDDFTNGIVYADMMFDMRVLPTEYIPYAKLLARLLGKMDTKNYSFGDLEKEINKNTGTFYSSMSTYFENNDDSKIIPKFVVVSKSIPSKAEKMFELTNEVIYNTDFTNKERLKTMLTRHLSQLESSVKNNGLGYAVNRAASYFSNGGMLREITGGMEYNWFIGDLVASFDKDADKIIENLNKTINLLFTKENLILGTACNASDYKTLKSEFEEFSAKLNSNEPAFQVWNFDMKKKNEALVSSSKVQYVVKNYDFKKLGYNWDGKMQVLNSILSSEYLQSTIRVQGGAYGGWCSFSETGHLYFASYRDPNLKETLDNYDKTPEYIDAFEADEEKMLGYIIGTVSSLDYPLTASMKANVAYGRYFKKTTKESLQKERDEILSTTAADIRTYSKLVADVLKQNNICVYGNKEKIEANKSLFGNLVSIEKRK